jgi:hypothetical protein
MIFHTGFELKAYPSAETEYGDQIFVRVERRIAIIWMSAVMVMIFQSLESIEKFRCILVVQFAIEASLRVSAPV